MLTDHFNKKAKALLRAAKAGDNTALARVDAILHQRDLCLMKMQYVVAVETGFESWAALMKAHPVEQCYIISTDKKPIPKTQRNIAWQNMMVAAINEALARKLLTLEPGDHWSKKPGPDADQPGAVYRFKFAGSIDAIAYLNDGGYDELKFHVALWPTEEAGEWIGVSFSGFLAGEAWAEGWMERKHGQWLQQGRSKRLFNCRRDRLTSVAASTMIADGYRVQGPFCM